LIHVCIIILFLAILNCKIKKIVTRQIEIDIKRINQADWVFKNEIPINWSQPSIDIYLPGTYCYVGFVKIYFDNTKRDTSNLSYTIFKRGKHEKGYYIKNNSGINNHHLLVDSNRRVIKTESLIFNKGNYLDFYYISDGKNYNYIGGLFTISGQSKYIAFEIYFTNRYTFRTINEIINQAFERIDIQEYGIGEPIYNPCM